MQTQPIPLAHLERHTQNARDRTAYRKADLKDLVASIREHGLLQPLVVTKKDDGYTIVAWSVGVPLVMCCRDDRMLTDLNGPIPLCWRGSDPGQCRARLGTWRVSREHRPYSWPHPPPGGRRSPRCLGIPRPPAAGL